MHAFHSIPSKTRDDVLFSNVDLHVHGLHKKKRSRSYAKILEVNLFAFAYRLFHRDFSPINGASYILHLGSRSYI